MMSADKKLAKLCDKKTPPRCNICGKPLNRSDEFEYVLSRSRVERWYHHACLIRTDYYKK